MLLFSSLIKFLARQYRINIENMRQIMFIKSIIIKRAKLALLSSSQGIMIKDIKNKITDIEFQTIKFISKVFDCIPLKQRAAHIE